MGKYDKEVRSAEKWAKVSRVLVAVFGILAIAMFVFGIGSVIGGSASGWFTVAMSLITGLNTYNMRNTAREFEQSADGLRRLSAAAERYSF